jgi:uncharacterized lipoprotein NlpE involved in copper resistance
MEKTMKSKLIVLPAALLILLAGCDQKSDLATQASEAGKEVVQKAQESAQHVVTEASKTVKAASKEVADKAEKPVAEVKNATELALKGTTDAAREKTKSVVSKTREHGQSAEDEMEAELGSRK